MRCLVSLRLTPEASVPLYPPANSPASTTVATHLPDPPGILSSQHGTLPNTTTGYPRHRYFTSSTDPPHRHREAGTPPTACHWAQIRPAKQISEASGLARPPAPPRPYPPRNTAQRDSARRNAIAQPQNPQHLLQPMSRTLSLSVPGMPQNTTAPADSFP